ncbi:PASTA domain-containing protein [Kribbella jiaozuonensis]|uniref:Serine/threonine kinase n=1 Tax=Kribbella jiaozuonensis TaxID=2575441 RepID=A0A4V6XB38_9ACTN|nr:PASTA domain-containing protein [Kribbella jiaozuonensis]TKK76753.1 serine/threonine kinase [Kribbella jiaozuonensis]
MIALGSLVLLTACGGVGAAGAQPTVTATTTVTATQTSTVPATSAPPPSAARPSAQAGVVPNVVGLNHQLAQDTMQAAGFYFLTEEDATGQGRLLINDRNWVVVSQQPAGGTHATPDTKIILRSKKIGE